MKLLRKEGVGGPFKPKLKVLTLTVPFLRKKHDGHHRKILLLSFTASPNWPSLDPETAPTAHDMFPQFVYMFTYTQACFSSPPPPPHPFTGSKSSCSEPRAATDRRADGASTDASHPTDERRGLLRARHGGLAAPGGAGRRDARGGAAPSARRAAGSGRDLGPGEMRGESGWGRSRRGG